MFNIFLVRRRRREGKIRRQRTTFTHSQTLALEIEFRANDYISRGRRFLLAEQLKLTENQIKIWVRKLLHLSLNIHNILSFIIYLT